MNIQKTISAFALLVLSLGLAHAAVSPTGDSPTKYSNQGSIANTRHNMTQRQGSGGGPNASIMDQFRNNYEEVCVYCHTPHGANTQTTLPLWNRTMKATTYSTYNELGTSTLTQAVAQPGANSLACLSCHDGQTAVDSIINMPGTGRNGTAGNYLKAQETTQSNAFLNTWPGPAATEGNHMGLSNDSAGCLSCHGTAGIPGMTNFTVFAIGTDLKNDHPVGVTFPATNGTGTNFNTPGGTKGTTSFFDVDSDTLMAGGEVRLYDNGGSAKVECASCHDPHGVPTAGAGSVFKPSFLRVVNTNSAICLTCHIK